MVSLIKSLVTFTALFASHSFANLVARNDGPTSPPCGVSYTPYLYAGCYTDPGSPHALAFSPVGLNKQNMTIETCTAVCKGNNFRYAGIEYYGECYCGNSIRGNPAADNACTFQCTGNKTQTCGGNKLVSVYMDPTYPTSDSSSVLDYAPQGCYTEGYNGRAVAFRQSQLSSTNLTTEACLGACKGQNYPLAATEYGGECYCGVVLGNGTASAPDTDCSTKCAGDSTEICGGRSRLNLYVASDLMSTEPCSPVVLPPPIVKPSTTTSQTQSTTSTTSSSTDTTTDTTTTSEATSSSSTTSPSAASTSSTTSSAAASSSTASSTSSSETTTSATTESSSATSTPESTTTSTTSSSDIPPTYDSTTSTTTTSETSTSESTTSESTTSSSTTPETTTAETTTSPSSTSQTSTTSTLETTTTTPSTTSTSTPSTTSTTTPSTTSTTTQSITSSTTTPSTTATSPSSTTSTTTSSQPTTSKTLTTSTVTPTTSKTTTSSTTKCTTTAAPSPTCEYGCGKWCSKPIPIFTDHPTCKIAVAECILQIADCFLSAGWPASLQCAKYQSWCQSVSSYCGNVCYGGKCSKNDCIKSNPPIGGQTTTSTTANVCPATSTSTSTTSSTAPVPTVSSICVLPNGPSGSGYSNGQCVGGIQPPALTCNNLAKEFAQYPLKLYTSKESSQCSGYTRPSVPQACKDACLAQYNSCVGTYATGCKGQVQRGEQDSYDSAKGKCGNQYNDCLAINRNAGVGNRCQSFGVGWS